MKLKSIYESLILELFDDLTLSNDIHIDHSMNIYKYSFESEDSLTMYVMYMVKETTSDETISRIPNIKNPEEYWEIAFKSDGGYGLTGKGNFGFVYKNILSCMKDFMNKEKPNIISFSGYEAGMNLVYNRFMDKFLKNETDPKLYFNKYVDNLYVSQELINNVPERLKKSITDKIKELSGEFYDTLSSIKKDLIVDKKNKIIEKNTHSFFQNNKDVYYTRNYQRVFNDENNDSILIYKTVLFRIDNNKLSEHNTPANVDEILKLKKLTDLQDFVDLREIGFGDSDIASILDYGVNMGSRMSYKYGKYVEHFVPNDNNEVESDVLD